MPFKNVLPDDNYSVYPPSDVDRGNKSTRHTLGSRPGQAAPGSVLTSGKTMIQLKLQNGWQWTGMPWARPEYCVDAMGFIHLHGRINSGVNTALTVLCADLPMPMGQMQFVVASNPQFGIVLVDMMGTLSIVGNTMGTGMSLDNIHYRKMF